MAVHITFLVELEPVKDVVFVNDYHEKMLRRPPAKETSTLYHRNVESVSSRVRRTSSRPEILQDIQKVQCFPFRPSDPEPNSTCRNGVGLQETWRKRH